MFYGEKIKLLREMFSYTREELASKLTISEFTLWEFETNQTLPTFIQINQLKSLFNVQPSFFYAKNYIHSQVIEENIAYREKVTGSRKYVWSEKVYLDALAAHLKEIESVISPANGHLLTLKTKIQSSYSLDQLNTMNLKEIASLVREELQVDLDQLPRLMYRIELAGAYVVERKIKEDVDAYSVWIGDNHYPVIVLNKCKNPEARRNFDLGHELGHLLLHSYVNHNELTSDQRKKIEKEANLFSSYLNLPEHSFKADFMSLDSPQDPDSYLELKEKYHMSIQAMAYRAYTEGWMSKEENRLFWRSLTRKGYKKHEPLDHSMNIVVPGKIRALIIQGLEKNLLTLDDLLNRFHVTIEFLEDHFGFKKNTLLKYQNSSSSQEIGKIVEYG